MKKLLLVLIISAAGILVPPIVYLKTTRFPRVEKLFEVADTNSHLRVRWPEGSNFKFGYAWPGVPTVPAAPVPTFTIELVVIPDGHRPMAFRLSSAEVEAFGLNSAEVEYSRWSQPGFQGARPIPVDLASMSKADLDAVVALSRTSELRVNVLTNAIPGSSVWLMWSRRGTLIARGEDASLKIWKERDQNAKGP
jgi:hypothetical protein